MIQMRRTLWLLLRDIIGLLFTELGRTRVSDLLVESKRNLRESIIGDFDNIIILLTIG
jgi:hypothetical protein